MWLGWLGRPPSTRISTRFTYHLKDSNGKPTRIKDRSRASLRPTTSPANSRDEEAKAFNPWNLLRGPLNGPADDWDPANVRAQV